MIYKVRHIQFLHPEDSLAKQAGKNTGIHWLPSSPPPLFPSSPAQGKAALPTPWRLAVAKSLKRWSNPLRHKSHFLTWNGLVLKVGVVALAHWLARDTQNNSVVKAWE